MDDEVLKVIILLKSKSTAPQITSPPTVTNVTDNTAVISWSTDEPADSEVQYGDNSAAWDSYDLSQYRCRPGDQSQCDPNRSFSQYRTIISGSGQPTGTGDGPVVSEEGLFPPARIPTPHPPSSPHRRRWCRFPAPSATIVWETNEPSDSRVEYGLTTGYGSTQSDGYGCNIPQHHLNALQPATTYQFRVGSQDIAGNPYAYSGNDSFTTGAAPDTTPPVIVSTPTVTNITYNSAIVEWETDEPATSIVQFGRSTSYARSKSLTAYVTNHSVTLTLLESETLYHFRVGSTDEAGNGPRYSTDDTFTTDPAPDVDAPVLTSSPTVTGVTDTTATIVWDTDEPSNSQVRYELFTATWAAMSNIKNKAEMVQHHTVTLTGLTDNTQYYFRVGSTDAAGNGPDSSATDNNPSAALSLTTQAETTAPVIISAPTVTAVTESTATIVWDTDEPSNSQVRYAISAGTFSWSTYPLVKNSAAMVTHHSVTLTGLIYAQPYYFRVGSTDLLGNGPNPLFTDDHNPTNTELTFTTLADQTPPTITASPTVTGKTNATATIEWSTDEPSNSLVRYDTQSRTWATYASSQNEPAMVTNHSVTITGLSGNTTYYFRIGSTDAEGNGPTTSNQVSFTTNTTRMSRHHSSVLRQP